jgi:NAD+ synthase
MRPAQARIIADLHVQPTIDPAAEVARRVGFLADYLTATGAAGFVLGISGGQDSSLAGRLCQLAVQRLVASGVDASFIAVRLPYGVQADEDDAQLALSFIQPTDAVPFDIQRGVDGVQAEFDERFDEPMSDFTKGNVKARSRMIAQYAIAGQNRMLVVGTDHAAEAVTGFFTKFGDGGADILPLSGLSKRQGRALLEHLGAPERLYLKDRRPTRREPRPDRRGEPRPQLLRHRRLPRRPRGCGCRGRCPRSPIPRDRAQARSARHALRRVVAGAQRTLDALMSMGSRRGSRGGAR